MEVNRGYYETAAALAGVRARTPRSWLGDGTFALENEARGLELGPVDVFDSVAGFPQVGWLKPHALRERKHNADPDAILVPSTASCVVVGLVRSERTPDSVSDREGIRDSDPIAIAVDTLYLPWTKSPDIHVAFGDLELANGDVERPVDAKLVLVVGLQ